MGVFIVPPLPYLLCARFYSCARDWAAMFQQQRGSPICAWLYASRCSSRGFVAQVLAQQNTKPTNGLLIHYFEGMP